ncbi:MAG: tRNA (adenosine(37)-N6)-threonylcarbamoyltransferase complex ATPase subunit type 1 TsaE [Desulfobacteraceae bacterium]|jgi:tRNA threonylcarbamoyladenosine biosynthesis protein TsaE|nr:MAG: tRNA (adenosine(37)-N6)-threonylcarbamoyltransferase complex ATPase subunit type 1 TsaE [Desulfobacteraceae bacterium]
MTDYPLPVNGGLVFYTSGPSETMELGQRLGEGLDAGDVVALTGELGTGKTCFAKGVALGLGLPPSSVITSPSFSLVNEYEGGRATLYHMDVYRLESLADFVSAGLEEYFYAGGVVLMEWADKWPEILPAGSIRVHFNWEGESERGHILKLQFSGLGSSSFIRHREV